MKPELHIRDLWTRDGEVGRATYVTWGVSLTVVKFIVDSIAVTAITDGVVWTPWSYLLPGDVFGVGLAELQPGAAVPLLLLSVPFVFVGVNLTLRRLRSVGWRPAGVILFFVPLVNLLLFAALCAIPASSSSDGSAPARPIEWLPKSGDVAAVVAILIAGALGAVVALLSMDVLNVYGWGLFIGTPFILGFLSVLIYCAREPRSRKKALGVALTSVTAPGLLLMGLAMEGALCVLLVSPIGLALGWFGGLVAYHLSKPGGPTPDVGMTGLLVALLPALIGADYVVSDPTRMTVEDRVHIDASPEQVWDQLKAVDGISVPKPFLLRIGAPVPLRCTLEREAAGARRTCYFDQGQIEERVLVYDRPRRMSLEIVRSTLPGRHWLEFESAEYRLERSDGGTELVRTTTHRSALGPRWYWAPFEAMGVHAEHEYMLNEIAVRSRSSAR